MIKVPVIGVTANTTNGKLELNNNYLSAVLNGGGAPVILPYTENERVLDELIAACDGFRFSGGGDIDPEYYGEPTLPACGAIDPERDVPEMALLKRVLATNKPILAICRGSQLVNIALGGTLWQDISSQLGTDIEHRILPGTELAHDAKVLKGTPLYDVIGYEDITINTVHHQAVKALGKGLYPMVVAPDGIVEGYYLDDKRYVRADQWHPERIYPISKESAPIFADFINACKQSSTKE